MRKLIYPIVISSILGLLVTDVFMSSCKRHSTKTGNLTDSVPENKTNLERTKKSVIIKANTYQSAAHISN